MIGVWNKEGKLLGCVVNYACHGTTGPSGMSANWIYHLENTIRGAMGKDAVVVFLQGACGDVTQVDNRNPYVQPGQDRWGEIVGCRVGAEAVKVLVGMERGTLSPLDAKTRNPARQAPCAQAGAGEEVPGAGRAAAGQGG